MNHRLINRTEFEFTLEEVQEALLSLAHKRGVRLSAGDLADVRTNFMDQSSAQLLGPQAIAATLVFHETAKEAA